MKKLSLTFLILIFATTLTAASVDFQIQDHEPAPVEAGEYFDLYVQVENTDFSEEAEDVQCELNPRHPFEIHDNQPNRFNEGDTAEERDLGSIRGGGSQVIEYRVFTDSQAVEGHNSMEIGCGSEGFMVYRDFDINVIEGVSFSLNNLDTVSGDIEPDAESLNLEVDLANVGGSSADLVSVELDLPRGFSSSGSYTVIDSIGTINDGDTEVGEFEIDVDEDVEPGRYEAELMVSYDDSENVDSLSVPLIVQEAPLFEISGLGTVEQDFDDSVVVDVENTGFDEADSTSVTLQESSDQPIEFTESYSHIGDLEVDGSATGVFDLEVDEDAEPGSYLVDAEIRYMDGDDVRVRDHTLKLELESSSLGVDEDLYLIPLGVLILLLGVLFWKKEDLKSYIQ